ncbi:MAG TPA: CopG family transcriptional regulator [bacterium]|nr:CopG family transcriptional regulator [bacterium]
MTTDRQANTSVFIDPKLKLKAKIFCVKKDITLTELVSFAIREYIKTNQI